MDPNLLYWKDEGKSFLSRLRIWTSVLDPISLLSSDAEIQNARSLIGGGGDKLVKDEKVEEAWMLSLSSVHADTGAVLPISYRPTAFLLLSGPMVMGAFLPHVRIKQALFWQFFLQSYSTGFNFANRNSSSEQDRKPSLGQLLLVIGTVGYTTIAGALPQIFTQRLGMTHPPALTVFRSVLPVPLSAALAYFSVLVVRSEEYDKGIQVFDSNGDSVGLSKEAGAKAVRETALSRAALLGTAGAVPNLLVFLFQKTRLFKKRPLLITPIRSISTMFILGLMIPVSFSLFPQLGTVKRENIEKELQALTVDDQLFYHRGL